MKDETIKNAIKRRIADRLDLWDEDVVSLGISDRLFSRLKGVQNIHMIPAALSATLNMHIRNDKNRLILVRLYRFSDY